MAFSYFGTQYLRNRATDVNVAITNIQVLFEDMAQSRAALESINNNKEQSIIIAEHHSMYLLSDEKITTVKRRTAMTLQHAPNLKCLKVNCLKHLVDVCGLKRSTTFNVHFHRSFSILIYTQ